MLRARGRRSRPLVAAGVLPLITPGVLLLITPGVTLADASGQARQAIQALCDRGAARYRQRDLTGYMAMYSPTLRETNVTGRTYDYRETLAGVAADFAAHRTITAARFQVRSVALRGATAEAVVDCHFASRAAGFTHARDDTVHPVWAKAGGGGREVGGQMTRDTQTYQRAPQPLAARPAVSAGKVGREAEAAALAVEQRRG